MKKLFLLTMVIGLIVVGCESNETKSYNELKKAWDKNSKPFDLPGYKDGVKEYTGPTLLTKNGGIIRLGMTPSEVLNIIKYRPNHINRTTGSWGVHEQWVYLDGWSASYEIFLKRGTVYFYFENDKLTSWQD